MKSINDVALPDRASNKLRGDVIRLGDVYVCDNAHDEILKNILQEKNWIMMNLFWKEK